MLIEDVERAIGNFDLKGRRILVAVSGGVDSTVLLRALVELIAKQDLQLAVGHVQHGLRGEASRLDQEAVLRAAQSYGLSAHVAEANPQPLRDQQSGRDRRTLQEAAREVRSRALRRMAEDWGADHIATAHNLDDQTETILMRLLRGTGPTGLQGIEHQSADGLLLRPLLSLPREQILEFASERDLSWREDASNDGDAYTRNRLRHHWIPGLRDEFNPQMLRAVGRLADAMQEEESWIRLTVTEVSERMTKKLEDSAGSGLVWSEKGWEELPNGLALRVIRSGLHELGRGRDVTRVHLQRVVDFLCRNDVETGRCIELPGGDRVVRTATGYRLEVDSRDEFPAC
ncbi:MAG: tRNA lysidine(34) synthetase TilS [Myxococcota bacterium]|nr:tRNA lysidine(34) synthetase TilS [Myxococcota bacterium]